MSPRPGWNKSPKQRKEIVALNHFSKHISREELAHALGDADDTRAMQLANLMLDPEYAKTTVGVLANKVGLTTSSVIEAYRKRKVAESTAIILKHAPQIMEDVAEDAKSRIVVCPTCKGEKVVEIRTPDRVTCAPCLTCEQTGKVKESGDNNARKLVFESIGLIGKTVPLIDARKVVIGDDDGLEETLKNIARARSLPDAAVTIDVEPPSATD